MGAESLLPTERDSRQYSTFRTAGVAENKVCGSQTVPVCFLSLKRTSLRKHSIREDIGRSKGAGEPTAGNLERAWSLSAISSLC